MMSKAVLIAALTALPGIFSHDLPPPPLEQDITVIEITLTCPEGTALIDGMCQGWEMTDAFLSCDKKNDMIENGRCVSVEESKPYTTCPEGSIPDKTGKKCFQMDVLVPEPYCPKGLDLVGSKCISKSESKQQLHCPPGYNLKKDECIRQITHERTPMCPIGYAYESEGKKEKCILEEALTVEAICKGKDFVLHNNECLKIDIKDPYPVCPKGYKYENGFCYTKEKTEPEEICPPGSLKEKKGCITFGYEPFTLTCKKGYQLEDKICKKIEKKPILLSCPKHAKLQDNMCVMTEKKKVDSICPPGTFSSKKDCLKKIEDVPDLYCEKDFSLIDGQCIFKDVCNPEVKCPDGKPFKGACTVQHTALPELICNDGSQLSGKFCLSYLSQEATAHCKKTGVNPGPEGCVSYDFQPIQLVCADGSKLNGEKCIREDECNPQIVCADGMEMSGKKCIIERHVQPDFFCPKGFSFDPITGSCSMVEYCDTQLTCPPHYILAGNNCIAFNGHLGSGKKRRLQDSTGKLLSTVIDYIKSFKSNNRA